MELLTTNDLKQHLFMQRVFFVFDITKRKAGKAQILRMSPETWDQECDRACLMGAILQSMESFRDPSNTLCFPEKVLKDIMNRFVEGSLGHTFNCFFSIGGLSCFC